MKNNNNNKNKLDKQLSTTLRLDKFIKPDISKEPSLSSTNEFGHSHSQQKNDRRKNIIIEESGEASISDYIRTLASDTPNTPNTALAPSTPNTVLSPSHAYKSIDDILISLQSVSEPVTPKPHHFDEQYRKKRSSKRFGTGRDSSSGRPISALLLDSSESFLELGRYNRSQDQSNHCIPVSKWFKNITGCAETVFSQQKGQQIINRGGGYLAIVNCETQQEFEAGCLKLSPFSEIVNEIFLNTVAKVSSPRETMAIQKKATARKGTDLWVKFLTTGFQKDDKHLPLLPICICTRKDLQSDGRYVDIAYLQSLPENQNAVFQVASNFTGVESKTELDQPTMKNFTKKYYMDRTQGPAASISAGAAAIVRVHAPFYFNSKSSTEWGQTEDNCVNILSQLEEHYPMRNGYVIFSEKSPKFPSYNSPAYFKSLLSTSVLYHQDVQVTTGHRRKVDDQEILELVDSPKQRIDQIFCAAVNLHQGKTGIENKQASGSEDKSRMVLDAAYVGTYLSAMKYNRSHIVLTLIGGGSFGNDINWILDSIVSAHIKWAVSGFSSLKKVTLVLWDPTSLKDCVNAFQNAGIIVREEISKDL
jgi:hypothetical protein